MRCKVICYTVAYTALASAGNGTDDIIRHMVETVAGAERTYELQVRVNRTYEDEDIGLLTTFDIRVRRSHNRFRYEGGSARKEVISLVITDGTNIWEYRPGWRQYIEESLTSRAGVRLMKAIRDGEFRFWRRFLLLAKFNLVTVREGMATVATRDGKYRCEVIRLYPKDASERSWEERLWIDAATGLVRKSVMKRRVLDENRSRMEIETVVWEHIALNSLNDEAAFRFQPPEDAKLVEVFRPPAGWQYGGGQVW